MYIDKNNLARQARYQAKKKAEFETLKLRIKEFEAQSSSKGLIDNSDIKAAERERCAQYCETNEDYPTTGKFLAAGIRDME